MVWRFLIVCAEAPGRQDSGLLWEENIVLVEAASRGLARLQGEKLGKARIMNTFPPPRKTFTGSFKVSATCTKSSTKEIREREWKCFRDFFAPPRQKA